MNHTFTTPLTVMGRSLVGLLIALGATLTGCSGLNSRGDSKDLGTLVLPLETSAAEGVKFRLRDAGFRVTSVPPGLTRLLHTDDRKTQEIRVELSPGTYQIEITSDDATFKVDRVSEDQSVVPAKNVELLSPSAQVVDLVQGEDTLVTFRFEVDGVELGFGELVLEVEVSERVVGPGSGGAGGSNEGGEAGSASGGGGGGLIQGGAGGSTEGGAGNSNDGGATGNSMNEGGAAGTAMGEGGAASSGRCNECLDVQVPDQLNQQCSAIAACAAVRNCAVSSQCYFSSSHECYCGAGISIGDCVAPTFVPLGACAAQVKAGLALDGQSLDNANVLGVMAAEFTTPGKAFGILVPALLLQLCVAECGL